ncbi:Na+/H+ antiporter subunit D [Acuticoccus sp. M5D2P5]|uniref:proton-conducting transporter transmembrane domain-containing protein n=1 Tax=Acuticoccus kalidii TaxID=2910977 RepID=UPI001F1C0EF5|nr:proton-conducting transporter membrane subunit [Acuticoccus kalidii]MCF3932802.1 Na+/H+ antiporter subunit D [Acuticoccus kalidii]
MADQSDAILVLLPLLIPLAAAALTAVLWRSPRAQGIVAAVGLAALVAVSLLLLRLVLEEGVVAKQFGSWAAPFGVSFVVDRLSAGMVVVSSILALAAAIFGMADLKTREVRGGFHPLFFGLLVGVNGAFLTGDIFNLYVWFEVMLITALGLLTLGRTKARLDGALRYAVLNLVSTIFFLMAIALLYGVTGTLNMADLARVLPETEPSAALTISSLLFLLGFGIKAGFFPLFFWLPASYHTASIVVSAVFAGLLTKVGIYAAFRVFTLIFEVEGSGIRTMVGVLAAGTMLFGVFGAATQYDVRRILSFHIVSQIGYIMLGLAISTEAAMAAAIFYIIHHIIVKANLFLLAGAIYRASGTFDVRKSGGLMRGSPLLAILFLIPALSLAGIPPFSGFWAKFLIVDVTFRDEAAWLGAIALFVGLLTIFSMTKIWMEAFWKAPAGPRTTPRAVPRPMLAAIGGLAAITLAISFAPEPLIAFADGAARSMADPATYIAAVFGETTLAEVEQ